MSTDESLANANSGRANGLESTPVESVPAEFPKPAAHGASVASVLNDLAPSRRDEPKGNRGTLYADAIDYWRENVGAAENEPYTATEFTAEWLPETSGEWVLILTSSGWKAGTGHGENYSQYFEQHLKLRERVEDADGNTQLEKPPMALHVEIMPQYRDLVYESGDPLQLPYGEGTRVVTWTTWAESPDEVERRGYDAIRAVYGDDAVDLADRNPESRRIQKAEAHVRFSLEKKAEAIETLEQTKSLIAWGGASDIDAHQDRVQEGWLEARVESDRIDLLGFEDRAFDTELKIYQIPNWHKRGRSDPMAHPKLEASFAGSSGQLPHVSEWDDAMEHLRTVVATHAHWAGVERSDLVADPFFDGPAAEPFEYSRPTGRRQHLKQRYEDVSTEVYREALKDATVSVYDILKVVAEESGASYDTLERRTGLARSTIRYHVARLAENGVLKRKGNPVLVVFVSWDLLERAREILTETRPGRTAEDIRDDADERREDREEREERDTSGPDTDDADDPDDPDDADPGSFAYLADLPETMREIAVRYYDDDLGDEDVRIRRPQLRDPGG